MRSVFGEVYGALRTQWAVANPLLGEDPLLFAMTTLWVREHNRVCDRLSNRWPEWTDDQLYAVARRTVVAQMMAIMLNEVLPAANPFSLKYDPDSYRDVLLNTSITSKTPLELLLTTMLPSGLPDGLDDTRSVRVNISVYRSCPWLVSMNNHRRIMSLNHPMTRDGYNIIFYSQWSYSLSN
jgi:hypothetical protein